MRVKDLKGLPDGPLKRGIEAQLQAEAQPVALDSGDVAESPQTALQATSGGVLDKPRHKYGAVATERDGMRFDSKAEARYYDELKLLQESGEVAFFLRQVPWHLPGGVTYRADFLVFLVDGTVEVVDVKGVETSDFKAKKRMVEALYPVKIKIVK